VVAAVAPAPAEPGSAALLASASFVPLIVLSVICVAPPQKDWLTQGTEQRSRASASRSMLLLSLRRIHVSNRPQTWQ